LSSRKARFSWVILIFFSFASPSRIPK
jgi:hypothetical protein